MGICKLFPKTAVAGFVLLGTSLVTPQTFAFTVDNIEYEKLTNSTVAVAKGSYSGDIVIPEKVSYLGETYTVTEIANTAFESMSGLASVSLPATIEKIGVGAFNSCSMLSSIVIPDKVTAIEGETFYYCSGLKTIKFPAALETIGDYAFYGCSRLDGLDFPTTLKSVGDYAFAGCEYLTEANFPDACESISVNAFMNCSSLSRVTLPASLKDLSNCCFLECTSLSEIVIPKNVTRIYPNVFYGCTRLSSVDIQGPVTTIDTGVFDGCSALESITLPNELETIGDAAFRRSALTEIIIPGNVTSIGYACFDRCPELRKVVFANGASTLELGEMAMGRLNAESLYIGRNLTYVSDEYGSTPFYNCTDIESIEIGSNVNDAMALYGARYTKLSTLTSNATVPPALRPFTEELYKTVQVTVPEGSLDDYREADVWKEFVSISGVPVQQVSVSGTVMSDKGLAIAGASVKLTSQTTLSTLTATTDADGKFSVIVSDLESGYNIIVTAENYDPYADVIEVEQDDIDLGEIILKKTDSLGNIMSEESTVSVYSLTGQYVGSSTQNLTRGIYIVSGQKSNNKIIIR